MPRIGPFNISRTSPAEFIKAAEDRAIATTLDAVATAIITDERASKSFLSGNAAVMSGSRMPGTSWSNQGGLSNKLIGRVTQNLSQSFGRAPEQLEAALAQQGLSWGPPFPPGRPLDPFWGYRRPPRTWDYSVGENVQVTPRWGRISFNTLRSLWNSYDIAQICTKHLINDVRSLDYHFEAAIGIRDDVSKDIVKARQFFDSPDKRQPFRAWLAEYLMDAIRYDAGSLYVRRTEVGDPIALEVINGTTLIPNIDFYGRIASDENDDDPSLTPAGTFGGQVVPAFTQIIEGMPWDWLALDDIIYQPINPMPDSQYGLAPLEAVLLTANTDLRFQYHFLQYFTEGSIPQGFMEAPQDLSDPVQIEEWQTTWDALMIGDQSMLRKIRWVPFGSQYKPVGPATEKFDDQFPLYLMRRTCAAHGVTPADLGFTETVNKATSETQVDVQFRVGTLPIVRHVEDMINLFLANDLKLRVRIRFDTGREIEDRLTTAQADLIYVNMGAISPDEPRARLGYPVSMTRPTPRFINNTRSGPIPLLALESLAGKIDRETFGPARDAELIDHPFVEVPGVMPVISSTGFKNAQNTTAAMQSNMVAQASGKPPPHPDDPTTSPKPRAPGSAAVAKAAPFKAAGIAVVAQDSGRVLMIQRDNRDPSKKAAGRWEMPGGVLDKGEAPWEAAQREWEEETGNKLPEKGCVTGTWENEKGPYRLFVYAIKSESDVNLNPDRDDMEVTDPDHPNARQTEVMAWWSPEDAKTAGKALRKELRDFDWSLIEKAAKEDLAKRMILKDAFASIAPDNTGGPGVTRGVLSSSGMHGEDLIDDDDEEEENEDDAEKAIALRRWRENARNRLRKGLPPRRFTDTSLSQEASEAIWGDLSRATTRAEIDRAFALKAQARSEPGEDPEPADDPQAALRDALAQVVAGDVQRAAIRASFTAVHGAEKSADPQAKYKAHQTALAVLLRAEMALEQVVAALIKLWGVSGLAGVVAANGALGSGGDAVLPTVGGYADLAASVKPIAGGLSYALLYQLAEEIATGVADGLTVTQLEQKVERSAQRRAKIDAQVESRRAHVSAAVDVYRQNGVLQQAWVGGTCARCQLNASVSPIGINDSWPDGYPPVHGSCPCFVVPA